jgi:hypothetical protein
MRLTGGQVHTCMLIPLLWGRRRIVGERDDNGISYTYLLRLRIGHKPISLPFGHYSLACTTNVERNDNMSTIQYNAMECPFFI